MLSCSFSEIVWSGNPLCFSSLLLVWLTWPALQLRELTNTQAQYCFQFLCSASTLYVILSSCWADEWQIHSWLNGFSLWVYRLIEFVIDIDDDHLYQIPDFNFLTFINSFHSYYGLRAFSKCTSGQQLAAWLHSAGWVSSQVKVNDR